MSQCLILDNVTVYGVLKSSLDSKIAEVEDQIQECREELCMLIAATPDLSNGPAEVEGDLDSKIYALHVKARERLDELQDLSITLHLLHVAKQSAPEDVTESF